jgi:hypothetical protein
MSDKKLRNEDVGFQIVKRLRDMESTIQQLQSQEYPTVIVKTTTGDPTSPLANGVMVINTVNNNVKMWADGAFRTLATW